MVALLTRSLGQREGRKGLDTFTVPRRVQPAGRINRRKIWSKDGFVSIAIARCRPVATGTNRANRVGVLMSDGRCKAEVSDARVKATLMTQSGHGVHSRETGLLISTNLKGR